MAVTRADTQTLKQKEIIRYSDFTNDFAMNPFTGMLAKVTNEESVKQSLKNLVLTGCGERFYDSHKGSKVKQALFELYDLGLLEVMKQQLKQSCSVYEPRAQIIDIIVGNDNGATSPDLDSNTINVKIIFAIVNIPDRNFTLDLNIRRVR